MGKRFDENGNPISEEDGAEDTTASEDQDALSKSWNENIESLRKSLTSAGDEPLEKANKKKKPADEEDEYDEEDESEEEEGGDKKMKKSLSQEMAEADPDAEMIMDIEPFLKSLADAIGSRLDKGLAKLAKSMKASSELTQAVGNVVLSNAEMSKSIKESLETLGDVPIPSGSLLRKSGDRFDKTDDKKKKKNPMQIMQKAMKFCQEGKIEAKDVTVLESRLQKGLDIPENMQYLFDEEAE
jgi:hypothetical protein